MVALIIVGIIVILVIATSIVCYVKRDDIARAVMDKSHEWISTQIKANIPEGYSEADVDRITGNFFNALKDGKIDREKFEGIVQKFRSQAEDKNISTDEAKELLEEMQRLLKSVPVDKIPAGQ